MSEISLDRDELIESLRSFRARRDDVLHEDESAFGHHLQRLLRFLRTDQIVARVLPPGSLDEGDPDSWWAENQRGNLSFPDDPEEELALRLRLLRDAAEEPRKARLIGTFRGKKGNDAVNFFRSVVLKPCLDEVTHRLGKLAEYPEPEARALQAVPMARIPGPEETRIFLSHKSVDKPLVNRFYHALQEVGFDPWLDESDMPAGTNLERGILEGFNKSCAAVFFITENFRDEKYLAAEVDYAIAQKREKGKRFTIITLRFEGAAEVPGLLTPYIYKNVLHELEAYYELVRALPIEVGPVRWKKEVVE